MVGSTASAPLRGMRWGIKASFLAYLAHLPDAAMSATDGAVDSPEGFVFPLEDASDFDARTGAGELRFRGDVRLRGHGGMLSVRFANPRVTVDDVGPRLSVEDAVGARLRVATLGTPKSADGGGIEIPAALTAEAVACFNDVYPEGTGLDPVVIRGV